MTKKELKFGMADGHKTAIGLALAAIVIVSVLGALAPIGTTTRTGSTGINNGDTVFIGEQGLKFDTNHDGTYGDTSDSDFWLEGVPDTATEGLLISVDAHGWTVPSVTKGKYTATVDLSNDGAVDTGDFLYIDEVTITGDIILNAPTQDSIVGKTIPLSTEIVFKMQTNIGDRIPGGKVDIWVLDPDGNKYSVIDGQSLSDITLLGTTMFVGNPNPTTSPPPYGDALDLEFPLHIGPYKVRFMLDKASCNMLDVSSSEYNFTLRKETLTIEAVENEVVKGEDIRLTITGNPRTFYYLLVTQVDTDNPPAIKATADVRVLDTSGDAYPATRTPNLAAWIKTTSDCTANVTIDTTGAAERPYRIKVYHEPSAVSFPNFVPESAVGFCEDEDWATVWVESPWPMFQHDAQHTGRSPSVGPQTNTIKWTYDFPEYPGYIYDSRVVVGSGDVVYIGRKEGVYRLDPNGTLHWLFELPFVTAISTGSDGTIYAISRSGLSAIDQNGNELWQYALPHHSSGIEPLVIFNDKLYLLAYCIFPDDSMHLSLFSLRTDGTVSWIYDFIDGVLYENPDFPAAPSGCQVGVGGSPCTGPVVSHDGTIYVSPDAKTLYTFNPDGSIKWTRTFELFIGNPSIDTDGTILFRVGSSFADVDSSCYAISPDGEDVWICNRGACSHTPVIGLNETSYWQRGYGTGWGCAKYFLFSLNNQGDLIWEVGLGESNGCLGHSTALCANGIIYQLFSCILMAFDQDGEEVWSRSLKGHYLSEADLALGSDGTLYAATNQRLYAFGIDTTPPTVSSTSPQNGVTNVSIDAVITATFSEAMDSSTITTNSFTLAGSAISGTVTYNPQTYTATFTPDANLDYNHQYTATLSTAITDLAGNPLAEAYTWSFTTELAPESEQPQLKAPWEGIAKITQGNNAPHYPPYSHYDHGTWDNTYAIDVALKEASGVFAPADGVVKDIDNNPEGAGGKEIAIEHTGPTGKKFTTVYLHLSEIIVREGQHVREGQVIAKSGATGEDITGPHLHFHIWWPKGSEPEWAYDSHTMLIERLVMKHVGIDSDFREYDARKGDLDNNKIEGELFESQLKSQPPICAIELQKEGAKIDKINREFFDIYVGDSTDDTGIKEVRFSSDDSQNAIPEGEWTEWYDWNVSLRDWDAVNKTKRWSFATGGDKEVWAEVKDDIGQTAKCFANISAIQPLEKSVEITPEALLPGSEIDAKASYNWVKVDEQGEEIYQIDKIEGWSHYFVGAYRVSIESKSGTLWSKLIPATPLWMTYHPSGLYVHACDWISVKAYGFTEKEALGLWSTMAKMVGIPALPPGGLPFFIGHEEDYLAPPYIDTSDCPSIDGEGEVYPMILGCICSPGEVRIYDEQGRVTGIINGVVREEISNSAYFNGIFVILSQNGSYRYEVVGTEQKEYKLGLVSVEAEEANIFIATDIPTSSGAIHQYTIDWDALAQGEEGVTVQVDSDGDGEFEHTFFSDDELTQDEFLWATAPISVPVFSPIGLLALIAILTIILALAMRRKRRFLK